MIRRLVLFLSGRWNQRIERRLRQDDLCYYAPGVRPPNTNHEWTELSRSLAGHEKALADALAGSIECDYGMPTSIVRAFLNDYYTYTLCPVFALLLGIRELCMSKAIQEVLVVTARGRSQRLPLVGFQTTESLRGSRDLLYTRAGNMLRAVLPGWRIEYVRVRGDILCAEPVRGIVVSLANVAVSIGFIVRVFVGSLLHRSEKASQRPNGIILARAPHQRRFLRNLMGEGLDGVIAVVLPQITQGWCRSSGQIGRRTHEVPQVTLKMIARATVRTVRTCAALRRLGRALSEQAVQIGGVTLSLPLRDLVNEIRRVSVTVLYGHLLSEVLRSYRPDYLVNFELVGRMAGLEAIAARENGVRVRTVQTALVSSVPHPVFPCADVFFADSAPSVHALSTIGSRRHGQVVYGGPPFRVMAVRDLERFERIAYFTQPYEPAVTTLILEVLCDWARRHSAAVSLKIHPRDLASRYSDVKGRYSDVIRDDTVVTPSEILARSDLCVTRTSSVAKEALAYGTAVMLCLFTDLDRSARADYIATGGELCYCAYSLDEVGVLLDAPAKLCESARRLQASLFGGKTIESLVASVFASDRA